MIDTTSTITSIITQICADSPKPKDDCLVKQRDLHYRKKWHDD